MGDDTKIQSAPIRDCSDVRDSLLLTAVTVYNGLELEVTDPKDDQGDIEQEDRKS